MNVETIILDESTNYWAILSTTSSPRSATMLPVTTNMSTWAPQPRPDPDQLEENTLRVTVDGVSLDNIQHFYMQVDKRDKVELLRKLAYVEDFRGLAFFNSLSDLGSAERKTTIPGCWGRIAGQYVNVKYRKVILERFKDYQLTLLLATDLVARGIDIEHLECVINYDIPRDVETYTHLSGRTGTNGGRDGYVITFITHPEELKSLKKYASVRELVLKKFSTLF